MSQNAKRVQTSIRKLLQFQCDDSKSYVERYKEKCLESECIKEHDICR